MNIVKQTSLITVTNAIIIILTCNNNRGQSGKLSNSLKYILWRIGGEVLNQFVVNS
ncbi:hypothetical protein D3C77_677180 [compost metagenome]